MFYCRKTLNHYSNAPKFLCTNIQCLIKKMYSQIDSQCKDSQCAGKSICPEMRKLLVAPPKERFI